MTEHPMITAMMNAEWSDDCTHEHFTKANAKAALKWMADPKNLSDDVLAAGRDWHTSIPDIFTAMIKALIKEIEE